MFKEIPEDVLADVSGAKAPPKVCLCCCGCDCMCSDDYTTVQSAVSSSVVGTADTTTSKVRNPANPNIP